MADTAGRWARVSGDSQSEADQLPDIDHYCDTKGYAKGKIYEVHGKSAYKGAQDPYWQEVVKDIIDGVIQVVVCWMVDRLDRRNILHAIPMVLAVLDAGGRIEFSEQPECNLDAKDPDISDKVKAFSDRVHAAHQESQIKSKRILKAHRKRRDIGSAIGRPPWGYRIACKDHPRCDGWKCGHVKIFTPTATGRKYVPLIFQMIIDGKSMRDVAVFLTAENVDGKKWNQNYLANRLVKNTAYYGARRNNGALQTEALVSFSQWQEANAKVTGRARPGRDTSVHQKALLAPICTNPDCDATGEGYSPMYRTWGGYGVNRTAYYRCTGKGPQRKGCGNMILVSELDAIVIEAMLADQMNEHYEQDFIPGDDRSEQIGRLREQAMDAYRRGDKASFLKLDAEADQLATLPVIKPHWEPRPTGISEGDYFASLDYDQRREYIAATKQVRVPGRDDIPLILPRDWSSAETL